MSELAGTVFLLVLLAVGLPGRAAACVCFESEGLRADFGEARAVFAGRVVALQVVSNRAGDPMGDMVATLELKRHWKGPKKKLLQVRTCGTQTAICTCGTHFELGAHYIVFGVGTPLGTSGCQRTRAYTPVTAEPGLEWLGVEDLVRELDQIAAPGAR